MARKGDQLSRYSMYKKIAQQAHGLDLGRCVLSVSHSKDLCSRLGVSDECIQEANYPDVKINATGLPSESVTAVISDQVFEHIACVPSEAVAEVHRILVPGGFAIHTSCFLMPYHGNQMYDYTDETNGDYWRYTPTGLAFLHRQYARIVAVDGWGNPLMSAITGLGLAHSAVPEFRWHPLNLLSRLNRRSYAFVVWIIAQK